MSDKILPMVWTKEVNGFPGYFVSTDGDIFTSRQHRRMKKLKQCLDNRKYLIVGLYKDKKRFNYKVHRIVLETFIGLRPDGMTASHLNGDKTDNRLSNLNWEKHSINISRNREHGTLLIGASHPSRKVDLEAVKYIRSNYVKGSKGKTSAIFLSKKFNICTSEIRRIFNRENWKYV